MKIKKGENMGWKNKLKQLTQEKIISKQEGEKMKNKMKNKLFKRNAKYCKKCNEYSKCQYKAYSHIQYIFKY